ncbi:hypothetical protein CPT03_03515 [Pedobacter ginsengisoli]|jgi:Protein of unknown function (DUF3347).|uniref:DUF3347 domain-containing protein n=2 Tax=Pedobacter TaxID=84567 RepID=A0A2D1U1Y2_9SPHI|nr:MULTISPECIES: DUF3347 domain-containing protein [Pedobacter]ATP55599.1 hypothetical protein CPT03_03515 [Pedobacter ginsengisoli]NQX53002.1 DUF3347 domain-containing protein [Pedobacter panaciterrae]
MKKIFLVVAVIATAWINPSFAQSTQTQSLLTSYYDIKNALVNSDAAVAASKASEFSKALASVDMKSMPKAEMTAFMGFQDKLAFDAKHISETKDIAHQREHFANFSTNLFKLAKAVKLTKDPVYYDYCPMKKSYWLSENEAIKNPYFGKQMLTCGAVKETLK